MSQNEQTTQPNQKKCEHKWEIIQGPTKLGWENRSDSYIWQRLACRKCKKEKIEQPAIFKTI